MAASRGLGYACARALAAEGCALVICSRDEGRIRGGREPSSPRDGRRACMRSPPTSAAQTKPARSSTRRSRSSAASTSSSTTPAARRRASSSAMTEAQWQKAFEQNMLSFVRIVHAAVPELKQGRRRPHPDDRLVVDQAADPQPGAVECAARRHLGPGENAVARAGAGQDPRQRHCAGTDPDRAHRRARSAPTPTGRASRSTRSRRPRSPACRSDASAAPTNSPISSPFLRRTRRATSPARRSRSTAGQVTTLCEVRHAD